MLSGLSDAPTLPARCGCQTAIEHCTNNAHLVLHPFWDDELGSEKVRQKGHKHGARLERTPGLIKNHAYKAPSNVVGIYWNECLFVARPTIRFLVGGALGHKDADIITLMDDGSVRHTGSWK